MATSSQGVEPVASHDLLCVYAPKSTPAPVVKRLHDAFKQALEQDSYKTALARYDTGL